MIATLFQLLCIRLGVVTGQDLAQQCRRTFNPYVNLFLYVLAEIAIMATDLAEIIGSVIALNLLFGIPMLWGVLITAFDVLIIMKWWGKKYQVVYELSILVLILVVAGCFISLLCFTKPVFIDILEGFVPTPELFTNREMLYLAIAILGATVMPHNLYLHASICQHRRITEETTLENEDSGHNRASTNATTTDEQQPLLSDSDKSKSTEFEEVASLVNGKQPAVVPYESTAATLRYAAIDTIVALCLAFVINSTILIVGASAFWVRNIYDVSELQDAYASLQKYVGQVAATLFAIALLASGQSSTITGTLAGQIIMSGFLDLKLRPTLRRLITRLLAILPAMITLLIYGEHGLDKLLILSQVVLSFQLPFAIIPLVLFTCSKSIMGGGKSILAKTSSGMNERNGGEVFANGWIISILAWISVAIVSFLNIYLVIDELSK